MIVKYFRYDKVYELDGLIVYAYGQFKDGYEFHLRIPITSDFLKDISEDIFESFVKQSVAEMKPEYIKYLELRL